MKETIVEVNRSDLIFLQRVIETAMAEIEAMVADGDVKEDVQIDLDESLNLVREYLK